MACTDGHLSLHLASLYLRDHVRTQAFAAVSATQASIALRLLISAVCGRLNAWKLRLVHTSVSILHVHLCRALQGRARQGPSWAC